MANFCLPNQKCAERSTNYPFSTQNHATTPKVAHWSVWPRSMPPSSILCTRMHFRWVSAIPLAMSISMWTVWCLCSRAAFRCCARTTAPSSTSSRLGCQDRRTISWPWSVNRAKQLVPTRAPPIQFDSVAECRKQRKTFTMCKPRRRACSGRSPSKALRRCALLEAWEWTWWSEEEPSQQKWALMEQVVPTNYYGRFSA